MPAEPNDRSSSRYRSVGPLTRKIFVTLAAGAVAFLVANLISVEVAFQVGSSLFVGGVFFVVLFLNDVDTRLSTTETVVGHVDRGLVAYAGDVRKIANQRDADAQQLQILIRYVEEQLPRVIGQTLNIKQREEPLVRELTHSLNTPLAQIEATLLSNPNSRDTASMLIALQVCKSYITAFRQVATLANESGAWQPGSLCQMLRAAADLYVRSNDNNLRIEIDVPDTVPGYENNTLAAILLTLLENAIEAAPTSSLVSVKAHQGADVWAFDVANDIESGTTLSDEIYQRSWSSKPGHEGLGLDGVRNLLAAQAGTDLAHRCTDDRVTFTVRLPRRRA